MSIYSRATLGETDNQVVFNDYSIDPVFRVVARAPSKWQIRQQDMPVPFESGSSDFMTLIGDSVYLISGTMYPSSEEAYDEGLMALRTVSSLDFNQTDALSDLGYVPYVWGNADGELSQQVFMKPLYVQLAETTKQGFVQPFTIYSKVKDPTVYGGVLRVASTQFANFAQTTGSAAFPVVFPIAFGSTSFEVSSTAINNGTLPAYPVTVIVRGPVNHPRITNHATGEFIQVDVNLTSQTDQLNINYDRDTLDINFNGTSVINSLTTDSTLFKIQPGENVISLTGSSVSTYAYATVEYRDAWPLS